MTKAPLKTRVISPSDIIEDRSREILRSKLPREEAMITFFSDKYPGTDGFIEFLGKAGTTREKLFFQLKGTQADLKHYDCEVEFLNYCFTAVEPTFWSCPTRC